MQVKLRCLCEDRPTSAAHWEAGAEQHVSTESGFPFCRNWLGLRRLHYLSEAKNTGQGSCNVHLTER